MNKLVESENSNIAGDDRVAIDRIADLARQLEERDGLL